jgi:hypothetical protein
LIPLPVLIPFLAFGSVFALVMGCCWKYARRRLSDKEMAAWQWRSEHAFACWLRFVTASFLTLTVMFIGSFTAFETFRSPNVSVVTILTNYLQSLEPLLGMLFVSTVIGSMVFGFWFWNGIALYRGRLLERFENGSATDSRASSRQKAGVSG